MNSGSAVLHRASTLLAERGPGTVRTARDTNQDLSRRSEEACHWAPDFFNPALQHDQHLRMVLPPGVADDDVVKLPVIYVLPPHPEVPDATPEDTVNLRAEATAAWIETAAAVYGPTVACLFGRPATIPCIDGETDETCLIRCLAERVPTVDPQGELGDPIGDALARRLITDLDLGEITLPLASRFAVVFADFGRGYNLNNTYGPWYPALPAGDFETRLWPGDLGQWDHGSDALFGHVQRCWPNAIRSGFEGRFLHGIGEGAFGMQQTLRRSGNQFGGAIVQNGDLSLARQLLTSAGAIALQGSGNPAFTLTTGPARPPSVFLSPAPGDCIQDPAACETATFCQAWADADFAGKWHTTDPVNPGAEPLMAIPALLYLSAVETGTATATPPVCPSVE